MSDSEFLLSERMSVTPGKPVMAISIGIVIKRSTSSGDFPGAGVAICTWIFVTSGKASMVSFLTPKKPATKSAIAKTKTMSLSWSEARTIFSIMLIQALFSYVRC